MGMKEEAKKIICDAFGKEIAAQLDVFEDPKKYPVEFLEQCVCFLENLIGTQAARSKFEPLYLKYKIKTQNH